jgi:type II secretory pathway pseudopilin PulG
MPPSLPAFRNASGRGGFTLFEVCIAVFIGVMIMLAAVPSISGVIEEQRARRLFNQFDDLARQAASHAVTERRPYVLEWDDSGVSMHPLATRNPDESSAGGNAGFGEAAAHSDSEDATGRVEFGERLAPDLDLPASLMKDPPKVWTFWPTGTCEPAKITCHIADAPWTATYNPLTEQPVFASP